MVALLGCGGASSPDPVTATPPPPAPAAAADDESSASADGAADNEQLVERGAAIYGARCAGCHGAGGEGTAKGPPVVGAGALPLEPRPGSKRAVEFRAAADVAAWTSANMPGDAPGSLAPEEYLAVLAFALKANGVELGAEPLTAERLPSIVLH